MGAVVYHIVIVAVAVVAVLNGFRRGFMVQLPTLLGIVVAIVCCRLFGDAFRQTVTDYLPMVLDTPCGAFVVENLAAGCLFFLIAGLFFVLAKVMSPMMRLFPKGPMDSVAGALTGLFNAVVALSFAYNLLLAMNPYGDLLAFGRQDDGNLCEGVLLVAPSLAGTESVKDLAHAIQMHEAKKIS